MTHRSVDREQRNRNPELAQGKLNGQRPKNRPSTKPPTTSQKHTKRGPNRENSQGKDLGGFKEYLEGIWMNPSLVKKQCKHLRKKTKEKPRKTNDN